MLTTSHSDVNRASLVCWIHAAATAAQVCPSPAADLSAGAEDLASAEPVRFAVVEQARCAAAGGLQLDAQPEEQLVEPALQVRCSVRRSGDHCVQADGWPPDSVQVDYLVQADCSERAAPLPDDFPVERMPDDHCAPAAQRGGLRADYPADYFRAAVVPRAPAGSKQG